MGKQDEPGAIRAVPDELWREMKAEIQEVDPPKKTGRPRIDARGALNGIIYRPRTSCQWNQLPEKFGSDSSLHRTFQRWVEKGVFVKVWARLAARCGQFGAVEWRWQSVDGAIGRARSGGLVGPNPTDRGKAGSRGTCGSGSSILVEGNGGPLSVAVAGANVHDAKLLKATLEAVVTQRPAQQQDLFLDKGYDNSSGRGAACAAGYVPHIRRIGEERLDRKGRKTRRARRWVVERTLGWLSKCRGMLVRYEKKAANYLGLIQLARALIWCRLYHRLNVLG